MIRNEARVLRFGKEGEMQMISWDGFTTVEVRVGRIASAAPFPAIGKPAYLLQSDFSGEIGIKQACAQNTHLSKGNGLQRKLVAVVSLAPKLIGPVMSDYLVTGLLPTVNGEVAMCVAGSPGMKML